MISVQETKKDPFFFYPEDSVHAFYEPKHLKQGLKVDMVVLHSIAQRCSVAPKILGYDLRDQNSVLVLLLLAK